MKKNLLIVFVVVFSMTMLLSGCGGSSTVQESASQTQPAQQSTPASSAASQQPSAADSAASGIQLPIAAPGSVTLTLMGPDSPYSPKSLTQNLPVWQEFEKRTGVKINFEVVPSSQYTTYLQTRLAAANQLPDIMRIDDPVKYAMDGLILPLEDLINQYAPDIVQLFKDYPDIYKSQRAPDGHNYFISDAMYQFTTPFWKMIRKDWLDKLNLAVPTTIDDYYACLTAFKEKDPNGNGKADEVPYAGPKGLNDFGQFGSAWGLHLYYSAGFSADSQGKIQYEYMDPRVKELFMWVSKMYKEGLIDQEFLLHNDKQDQIDAMVSNNLVGSTYGWSPSWSNKYENNLKKAGITANYYYLGPLQGPEGIKPVIEFPYPVRTNGVYALSKDCKNKEVAIKWLDYVYATQEGHLLAECGLEGQSYTIQDGKAVYTDWALHNPDGLSTTEARRSLGAYVSIVPWVSIENSKFQFGDGIEMANMSDEDKAARVRIKDYVVYAMPNMLSLPEEVEMMSTKMTDIDTFREEMLSKFIMGQESFDNWDSKFVSELKKIGIEDVLKIKQAQYDRYMKK